VIDVQPPRYSGIQFVLGHRVTYDWDHEVFVYIDDGEVVQTPPQRPCVTCHLPPTEEGHDPCIANLPGIRSACCGHGVWYGSAMRLDGSTFDACGPEELWVMAAGEPPARSRTGEEG
jgi:hypothetical protein